MFPHLPTEVHVLCNNREHRHCIGLQRRLQPTKFLSEAVLLTDRLLEVVDPGQDRPGPAVHRPALLLQRAEDVLRLSDQVGHLPHHQGQGGVGDELQLVLGVLGEKVVAVSSRAHNPANISVSQSSLTVLTIKL